MNKFIFITVLIVALSARAQKTNYSISKVLDLKGDGSWDYLTVDESNERIFVSHGTMVHVIDLKTKTEVGTINDTKGVHGIALVNGLNKGYTSNGKDSSVTVFDMKRMTVLLKIKVTGAKPDAILYDIFSERIFVFNGKSNNATVIDPKTDKVIATIALDGKPEFSASNEKGKVFVNIETTNSISVINSSTLKVEKSWSLKPGEEPTGLAIDNRTHRLFSVCGNKMMVILNSETGKMVASVPIGEHCDGVTFDPNTKRIYASNGEGSVTIVQQENENVYKIIETVKTQRGAKTIAINSKTNHIYLPVAELGDTPMPTKEEPKPKPSIVPNTFKLLDITSNQGK